MEVNESTIRRIRENMGITQGQLAENLGVSIRTVQGWEAGKTIPSTKYEILRNMLEDSERKTFNITHEDADAGDSVQSRLKAYLEDAGISNSEFGRRIGVSNAYVTSIRKSIQPDKLEKIAKEFPDLNISWLITGDGEMKLSSLPEEEERKHGCSGTTNNEVNVAFTMDNTSTKDPYRTVLKIVESYQRSSEKFQEQIDRLISIIEKAVGTTRG